MHLAQNLNGRFFTFVTRRAPIRELTPRSADKAEAIARNLREMARLPVPIVVTITGEGGSGGALAIAVGDRVNMLENSVYSVISPEGCASILWRDSRKRRWLRKRSRSTARDLSQLELLMKSFPNRGRSALGP